MKLYLIQRGKQVNVSIVGVPRFLHVYLQHLHHSCLLLLVVMITVRQKVGELKFVTHFQLRFITEPQLFNGVGLQCMKLCTNVDIVVHTNSYCLSSSRKHRDTKKTFLGQTLEKIDNDDTFLKTV
jgi:hypothetical protein